MVQDLVHNLCESFVENIDGVSGTTPHKVAVATPVITLTGNSVTITCDTTGATIYYTLDGSTPTSGSTKYSAAFTLDSSCTIKAIAINGGKYSAVAEESYVKPIIYLTQWKIVGNSEVHGNEIWSCGEYNATDGKYHILVQPLGGSIADIALTEPLRKVNNVADTIEFPSGTEGKALITRNFGLFSTTKLIASRMDGEGKVCITKSIYKDGKRYDSVQDGNVLCNKIDVVLSLANARNYRRECLALYVDLVMIRNGAIEQTIEAYQSYFDSLGAIEAVYELNTPTTELVDAPQIQEADNYTCVISQGGKAVEWTEFVANPT